MPIIGCKQDHLSGLYTLTREGEKFTREEAFQLLAKTGVYDADLKMDKSGRISGKDIFSCILPKDFSYIGKSGIKDEKHPDYTVKVSQGKLISGVIDDKSLGSKKGLMLAEIVKIYDREEVNLCLQRMSLLGIAVLDMRGFTVLSSDSDLPQKAVNSIRTD